MEDFIRTFMPKLFVESADDRAELFKRFRTDMIPMSTRYDIAESYSHGSERAARPRERVETRRGLDDEHVESLYALILNWLKEHICEVGDREFERFVRLKQRELRDQVRSLHEWAEKHFGDIYLTFQFDSGPMRSRARLHGSKWRMLRDSERVTDSTYFSYSTSDLSDHIVITSKARRYLQGIWIASKPFDGAEYLRSTPGLVMPMTILAGPRPGKSGAPRETVMEAASFHLVRYLATCGLTLEGAAAEVSGIFLSFFPQPGKSPSPSVPGHTAALRGSRSSKSIWPPDESTVLRHYEAFAAKVGAPRFTRDSKKTPTE